MKWEEKVKGGKAVSQVDFCGKSIRDRGTGKAKIWSKEDVLISWNGGRVVSSPVDAGPEPSSSARVALVVWIGLP